MGSLYIFKHNKSSFFCCFILGMRTLFVYCKLCSLLSFSLSWNPTTSHGCSFRWVLPPLWFTRGENRYPFAFYLSFSLAENILTENINKKVSIITIKGMIELIHSNESFLPFCQMFSRLLQSVYLHFCSHNRKLFDLPPPLNPPWLSIYPYSPFWTSKQQKQQQQQNRALPSKSLQTSIPFKEFPILQITNNAISPMRACE